MTREELIEGVIAKFKMKRKRAAVKRSGENKEVVTFLMRARQQRRQAQLTNRKSKLQSASKSMKRALRKREA
jgi:hypothetical protein